MHGIGGQCMLGLWPKQYVQWSVVAGALQRWAAARASLPPHTLCTTDVPDPLLAPHADGALQHWVMMQHAVLDLCGVVALANLVQHEIHRSKVPIIAELRTLTALATSATGGGPSSQKHPPHGNPTSRTLQTHTRMR